MIGRRVAVVLLAVLAVGCSSNPVPTPTGSTCPPNSTLSYEGFGKPFMEHYCTRCHSSELHGADRNGAPLYHDFDFLMGILYVADHVDWWAAAGPDSFNEIMPPDGDKPSSEERYALGEWLACELAKLNNPADAGLADAAVNDAASADAGVGGSP